MTPAFVQGNGNFYASGQPTALAFGSNVTTGDLIVVAMGSATTTTTGTSVANSGTAVLTAWQQAGTFNTSATIGYYTGIFYAKVTAGGTCSITVTVNSGSAGFSRVGIHEYSGVDTLDQTAGAVSSSSGTTATCGPVTTTSAAETLFAFPVWNAGTPSAGAGYSIRATSVQLSGEITEDQIVASTGSYSATSTSTSSSAWMIQMATFLLSGGTTNATVTAVPGVSRGRTGAASAGTGTNAAVTATSGASRGRTGISAAVTAGGGVAGLSGISRGRTGLSSVAASSAASAVPAASRGRAGAASATVSATVTARAGTARGRSGQAHPAASSTVTGTTGGSRGRTGVASAAATSGATVTATSGASRGRTGAASVNTTGATSATVTATAGTSRGRYAAAFVTADTTARPAGIPGAVSTAPPPEIILVAAAGVNTFAGMYFAETSFAGATTMIQPATTVPRGLAGTSSPDGLALAGTVQSIPA